MNKTSSQNLKTNKKVVVKCLITHLVVLLCGNLVFSQNIRKVNKLEHNIVLDDSVWIESNRNIEIRKHRGVGFFHPYNLPDADNDALALFRTYSTPINTGFAILEVSNTIKDLRTLKGRVKFSGSDIDQTQDTLIIATSYSKTKDSLLIANLNKGLVSDNADVVKISEPLAQFESFHINLSESNNNEERKYLIIQIIIKSGSDDNYYYGISNAVIDNLHFTNSPRK